MSIESVMPSNHLILCHPLLWPSVFPSISIFSNELDLHIRWPKHWSFSIGPFLGYSGLNSFRIDQFDFLATQGILKSLLQHHSSKASIIRHSAFFMIQLSHPYMTTRRAVVLTIWTFVGKLMSLFAQVCHTFFPRRMCLLISWLQLPSPVILEPKKRKCHCFHLSPFYCQKVMGLDVVQFVKSSAQYLLMMKIRMLTKSWVGEPRPRCRRS